MRKLSAYELSEIGKYVSKKYLEDNIPLTETLQKVAHEYGLNKEQTKRVAEFANVETYLGLVKVAKDDKYIEFPVADINAVFPPNNEYTKVAYITDIKELYKDIDEPVTEFIWPLLEKTASENVEQKLHINDIYKVLGTYEHNINNIIVDMSNEWREIEKNAAKMEQMIKTELLQGTDISEIKEVFEKLSSYSNLIFKDFEAKHKFEFLNVDFTKKASVGTDIDYNDPLCQTIMDTNRRLGNFIKLGHLLKDSIYEYEKFAVEAGYPGLIKTAGFVKGTWNLLKLPFKHPVTTLALAAIPFAFFTGKRLGEQTQSVISEGMVSQVMPKYNKPSSMTI